MTMQEAYTAGRVEALKKVYKALGDVTALLRETAPNARDYPSGFEAARAVYERRQATLAALRKEITEDAKQLQRQA